MPPSPRVVRVRSAGAKSVAGWTGPRLDMRRSARTALPTRSMDSASGASRRHQSDADETSRVYTRRAWERATHGPTPRSGRGSSCRPPPERGDEHAMGVSLGDRATVRETRTAGPGVSKGVQTVAESTQFCYINTDEIERRQGLFRLGVVHRQGATAPNSFEAIRPIERRHAQAASLVEWTRWRASQSLTSSGR